MKKKMVFFFLLLLMLWSLYLCFSVSSILMFYIFFEMVLIPMMLMVFWFGSQYERLQAGMYLVMYTIFGSLPLLFMILVALKWESNSFFFFFFFWKM
uniref:NADH-ubiquinone oxidoreductase chain 4 n=1 Tax=Macrocheles nataliae TaxID=2058476 RepID=A0A6B9WDE8_9ACAR|nr:NADH dehydrogenase subunit 4L [Macrocheles nataliae]